MPIVIDYDHGNPTHREILAAKVIATINEAGFIEEFHDGPFDKTKERIFYFPLGERTRIRVFSSVVYRLPPDSRPDGYQGEVREAGLDAIRVQAVYRSKRTDREVPICRETRTHRTGKMDAIVKRMLKRMRNAWVEGNAPIPCPRCGAPTFTSKGKKGKDGKRMKGKQTCSEFCWKTDEQLARDNEQYEMERERKWQERQYWANRNRRR
ncbi:MAG: hypothetical protein ACYTFG_10810 [Planctomycetota bacterium]|jgi:hypothetical protein